MKKSRVIFCCVVFCFGLFVSYSYYQYKKTHPSDKIDFTSIEEFKEYGGEVLVDVPEGASDVKYYLDKSLLMYSSIYSFVINDETAYDTFMEKMKEKICSVPEGYHVKPSWECYLESFTEEEQEEMGYLKEHYSEMDYKEILSMSRHRYGFMNGYGAMVSDYINMDYSLAEFPMRDCFSYVTEGNLEEYTILKYYPKNSGTSTYGIIVNEGNRQFIVFKFATMR